VARAITWAVSLNNPRELIQAEKQEQEIAEGYKRLIKNCLICSQKLAQIVTIQPPLAKPLVGYCSASAEFAFVTQPREVQRYD
jgi:hypothetical protein